MSVPSVPDCQWNCNKRELNISFQTEFDGAYYTVFYTIAPKTSHIHVHMENDSVMKHRRDVIRLYFL